MGVDHPKGVIKNIVPIVMAGVLGIYGLIVAVIITQGITTPGDNGNSYSTYNGYTHVSVSKTHANRLHKNRNAQFSPTTFLWMFFLLLGLH